MIVRNKARELTKPPTKPWMVSHFVFLVIGLSSTLYFAFYKPLEMSYSDQWDSEYDSNLILSENIEAFFDHEYSYDDQSIRHAPFEELQPLKSLNWLQLPLTDKPVWLRFEVGSKLSNNNIKEWIYLEFGLPVINSIDVFIFNSEEKLISHHKAGDEVESSNAGLGLILPTVKFLPDNGLNNSVYIRLESDSFLATPLFILTADQLIRTTNWQRSYIIPYYGMILVMLFYNFFTYTFVRDRSYLYYFGHILFLLLYQAVLDGFVPETLIRIEDVLYLRGPVVYAGMANLCAIGFSRHMLNINSDNYWENITLKFCSSLVVLSLLLEFIFHNWVSSLAMMLSFSINCFVVLCVIFITLLKGNKLAGYFLLAWITYPILVTNYGITMAGLLPPTPLSIQAPRIGGIVETILLSVALGYRVELMRREKLKFQQTMTDQLQNEIKEISIQVQLLASSKYDESSNNVGGPYLAILRADFKKLSDALKKNEQDQKRWLGDISHELRTPISVFKATIESLQDGIFEANETTLSKLHIEAQRIERLVLDLHDLNMCENGSLKFSFKPINIAEVIAHEVCFFTPSLRDKGHNISLHIQTGETLVNADERRIAQLFANLLNNSEKYTHSPGIIKVTISASNGKLIISWEDSAPSVDGVDNLESLFERLYKMDQSRTREGAVGTGLGLSISKAIVQAHGGTIAAAESDLGGLKFTVILPLYTSERNQDA